MECNFVQRRMLFSSFFSVVVWQRGSADLKANYFNRMNGFVIGEYLYCSEHTLNPYFTHTVQRAQCVKRISHDYNT